MKRIQILAAMFVIISIISINVFAMPENDAGPNNVENQNTGKASTEKGSNGEGNEENNKGMLNKDKCGKCGKCGKDPLKRLEERKESIRQELKEGNITKEKADELTKIIDERITKIKEFNSLTLPEKKEHLTKKFNSHLEQKIKDGRITKEEGDMLLKDFNKQLEGWDGKEPLKFMHRYKKHKD